MLQFQNFKLYNDNGDKRDTFGELQKDYELVGNVSMKVSLKYIELVNEGVQFQKPTKMGHTATKTIKQGQILESEFERFRVRYVNNIPRLSVIYLEEIVMDEKQ